MNSLEQYRPLIGKLVNHGWHMWRIASIHADRPDLPWAWLVQHKNRQIQVRLSLRAECFDIFRAS